MPSARWIPAALFAAGTLAACSDASAQGSQPAAAQFAVVPPSPATAAPSPTVQPVPPADRPTIKWMLYQAAARHGVNAGLVMAVGWWESGWNQGAVSPTGAIGVMQVEPGVAAYAGPTLLGRQADPHNLGDNIELGTAILREDLDRYDNDLIKALVAYNSGPGAVVDWAKLDPGHQQYVLGIYNLAVAFDENKGPA